MRIFSGIQPTGAKHLGNYIGAIAQYVAGLGEELVEMVRRVVRRDLGDIEAERAQTPRRHRH